MIPDEKWTTEDAGVWSTKRRESWRLQLCAYLEAEQKRSLEERRRKMVAEMKLKRVDSYFQLLALDGQFLLTVGEGLSMFAPVDAVELESCPLHKRNHASVVWDTAANNCSPSAFCLYSLNLRISVFWDPLHKIWRCLWNSCREAGFFSSILVSGIIASIERGSYEGEANWNLE